jgi:hypothetical protein
MTTIPVPNESEKCREGCSTQNHSTYAECLRDANISIDKESLKTK